MTCNIESKEPLASRVSADLRSSFSDDDGDDDDDDDDGDDDDDDDGDDVTTACRM